MKGTNQGFALITGSSRGIGKALAEECARHHYDLALVALPGEDLEELAAALRKQFKVDVRYFETDLSKAEAADTVMAWVETEKLHVTMLINNAGLGSVGPTSEAHDGKHRAMLNLNMATPYLLARLLLPSLLAAPKGYIINISSQAAFYPIPFKATYSSTKAFLMYFSLALEYELRGTNVHVSVVCPSGVKTSPIIRERIATAGMMSRWVALEPEEVAKITLKNTFRKKRLIIPGKLNRLSYFAAHFTPDFIKMKFIARKMKRNPFDT